ncbi:MAG: pilus assembly protein PilP [Thermodesulfobacteriota bacterium]|nr:pilus assembly protein PilP [Thermodesulfobacteriota bacterium]
MKKLKRMQRKRRINKGTGYLTLFLICGLLCYLPGCGGNSKPPESKKAASVPKVKAKKKAQKTVKKVKKPIYEVEGYFYDPMGKKDPFMPLIAEEGDISDTLLSQGPLTPLQKYSLAELQLVAVLQAGKQSKAMVEDGKGDGYILSKGTLIGDKYGEVVQIKDNEVIIVEKEIDVMTGEIKERTVSLVLHKPEEEEL